MINSDEIEIVLVEDNPNDAELIARVLRKHNLANKMIVLRDGVEALDFFWGQSRQAERMSTMPKVVLLDLKLPKVDGIEVLRRMKSDGRTKNIPVVILTSSTEQRDLDDAYALGANSFVTKPIKFNEFAKVVAELGLYWVILNRSPAR